MEVNLCFLAVKYTEATSCCPYTIWWTLFIHVHIQKDQYSFCNLSSPPPSLHSPLHSGAKGVCVRWPNSPAGWREWVAGCHLHSRAWSSRCWGFLGDGAVRAKWEAKSGWTQQHHHHTCALHVAAAELRPGEDANLCGAPPSPANRVPHTLHTKCSV